MSGLAEDAIEQPAPRGVWLKRTAIALAAVVLIALLVVWLRGLGGDAGAPKRQVAKISLLPDTPPPPPPPPPKEAPKPRPPDAPKPQPQPVEPKAPEAPAAPPERLNLEGKAGDGPSAFGAGGVGNDYKGGDVGVAASRPAGGSGTASDRAQERFFANSARQLLRDEIERNLKSEAQQLTASFAVWFEGDGSIRRYEVAPSGDDRADAELNAALGETARTLKLPPPAGLQQPLRFRLTVRPLG